MEEKKLEPNTAIAKSFIEEKLGVSVKQVEINLEHVAKIAELINSGIKYDIDPYEDHALRSETWATVAQELSNAQQAKKHFSILETNLKEKLQELSEDISSKGGDFVFTRFMSKGAVDYKAIPQLSGVDLDSYRKEGFSRWKLTKV